MLNILTQLEIRNRVVLAFFRWQTKKRNFFFEKKDWQKGQQDTRIVQITASPPFAKQISLFSRGGNYLEFSWNFHFFDSKPFQMSSSELNYIS